LVVSDGSTDKTVDTVHKYKQLVQNLEVVDNLISEDALNESVLLVPSDPVPVEPASPASPDETFVDPQIEDEVSPSSE
jgi:hypothetical protein